MSSQKHPFSLRVHHRRLFRCPKLRSESLRTLPSLLARVLCRFFDCARRSAFPLSDRLSSRMRARTHTASGKAGDSDPFPFIRRCFACASFAFGILPFASPDDNVTYQIFRFSDIKKNAFFRLRDTMFCPILCTKI